MKTRESGMPDEATWAGFFQPEIALTKLGLDASCRDVLEFGCGYGTFSIPAARIVRGVVHALDIDRAMIATTCRNARDAGLTNVRPALRDFVERGSGLDDASIDYVMLFNILHATERDELLREAHRVLRSGGILAVMHWNYDANTPRGPSMSIRPRPHELRIAAEDADFIAQSRDPIDLPPFHYGWIARKG